MKNFIICILIICITAACKKENKLSQPGTLVASNHWQLKKRSVFGAQIGYVAGDCELLFDSVTTTLKISGNRCSDFLPAGSYQYSFYKHTEYRLTATGTWVPYVRNILKINPAMNPGYLVYSEYGNKLYITLDPDFGMADDEYYYSFER